MQAVLHMDWSFTISSTIRARLSALSAHWSLSGLRSSQHLESSHIHTWKLILTSRKFPPTSLKDWISSHKRCFFIPSVTSYYLSCPLLSSLSIPRPRTLIYSSLIHLDSCIVLFIWSILFGFKRQELKKNKFKLKRHNKMRLILISQKVPIHILEKACLCPIKQLISPDLWLQVVCLILIWKKMINFENNLYLT